MPPRPWSSARACACLAPTAPFLEPPSASPHFFPKFEVPAALSHAGAERWVEGLVQACTQLPVDAPLHAELLLMYCCVASDASLSRLIAPW